MTRSRKSLSVASATRNSNVRSIARPRRRAAARIGRSSRAATDAVPVARSRDRRRATGTARSRRPPSSAAAPRSCSASSPARRTRSRPSAPPGRRSPNPTSASRASPWRLASRPARATRRSGLAQQRRLHPLGLHRELHEVPSEHSGKCHRPRAAAGGPSVPCGAGPLAPPQGPGASRTIRRIWVRRGKEHEGCVSRSAEAPWRSSPRSRS